MGFLNNGRVGSGWVPRLRLRLGSGFGMGIGVEVVIRDRGCGQVTGSGSSFKTEVGVQMVVGDVVEVGVSFEM